MKICWYWSILEEGIVVKPRSSRERYANCIESSWEPSGESHSWEAKEADIFSWADEPTKVLASSSRGRKRNVSRVLVESKI